MKEKVQTTVKSATIITSTIITTGTASHTSSRNNSNFAITTSAITATVTTTIRYQAVMCEPLRNTRWSGFKINWSQCSWQGQVISSTTNRDNEKTNDEQSQGWKITDKKSQLQARSHMASMSQQQTASTVKIIHSKNQPQTVSLTNRINDKQQRTTLIQQ